MECQNAKSSGATFLNLESKALGFRSRIVLTASFLEHLSTEVFAQPTHRQETAHITFAAKHWQYLTPGANLNNVNIF